MRGVWLPVFVLCLWLCLGRAEDDLAEKLKHLEEDVALVKELLKLRGSVPSSSSSSSPSLTTAAPSGTPAPSGGTSSSSSSDGSYSSSTTAPPPPPASSPTSEAYPPANSRYNDLKSTVTFDAPADRSRLAIVSFKYNPQGEVSSFVDKIFGSHAMYYDDKMAKELGSEDISDGEIRDAQARFREAFQLRPEDIALSPACSVDMLGLWHPQLNSGPDDPEFNKSPGVRYKNDMLKALKGSAALGDASLHMSSLVAGSDGAKFGKEEWKCYYRDLWKLDNRAATVFFYCPSPSKLHCDHLELMATHKPDPNDFGWGRVKVDVAMKSLESRAVARVVWRASLEAKISWRGRAVERENTKDFKRRAGMAVCTVIPYSTSDKEKAHLNGVMVFEWLRYYLRMGYKVRRGAGLIHSVSLLPSTISPPLPSPPPAGAHL